MEVISSEYSAIFYEDRPIKNFTLSAIDLSEVLWDQSLSSNYEPVNEVTKARHQPRKFSTKGSSKVRRPSTRGGIPTLINPNKVKIRSRKSKAVQKLTDKKLAESVQICIKRISDLEEVVEEVEEGGQ